MTMTAQHFYHINILCIHDTKQGFCQKSATKTDLDFMISTSVWFFVDIFTAAQLKLHLIKAKTLSSFESFVCHNGNIIIWKL